MEKQPLGKPLNPLQIGKILALREQGKTQKEIKQLTGFSTGSIGRHIRKAKDQGAKFPLSKGESISDRQLEAIAKLRAEGKSALEISAAVGVSKSAVYKRISGLPPVETTPPKTTPIENNWYKIINKQETPVVVDHNTSNKDILLQKLRIENELLRDLVIRLAGAK